MADSLMPRSDSFNARVRGASHIDFKTATTGVAAKAMRNELSALVNTVKDPETRKVCTRIPLSAILQMTEIFSSQAFDTEMQSFFYLFTRYLSERARSQELYAFTNPCTRAPIYLHPPGTGTSSNRPRKTRSSPTPNSPLRMPPTLASLPSSKSMVVLELLWVRPLSRPPPINPSDFA